MDARMSERATLIVTNLATQTFFDSSALTIGKDLRELFVVYFDRDGELRRGGAKPK
jgi:hypothetical protein